MEWEPRVREIDPDGSTHPSPDARLPSMLRLLKLLLLATLLLPLLTGTLAVALGFGDTWGMGSNDPIATFVTAALPILPPGLYQVLAWPATFGVAFLLAPLAAVSRGQWYTGTLLLYLAALVVACAVAWGISPDHLNALIDGTSYVPGRLNSTPRKLGVFVLADSVAAAAAVAWWQWRR